MIVRLKNKDTLIVDEFKLKCCIGKKGISKNKHEGDLTTPYGKYMLGKLYWRQDKVKKPITKLTCKKIKKNMVWCNDSKSTNYNKEIKINKKFKYEKIFRKDYKYDLLIPIYYNYFKPKKYSGSAIFLHLTKNFKPTLGCIALKKKDFLILLKLINKKTKIKLN